MPTKKTRKKARRIVHVILDADDCLAEEWDDDLVMCAGFERWLASEGHLSAVGKDEEVWIEDEDGDVVPAPVGSMVAAEPPGHPIWAERERQWKAEQAAETFQAWYETLGRQGFLRVTLSRERYGEEAWISAIELWGHDEWVGSSAAERPSPLRVIDQDEGSITYTCEIPGLLDGLWRITEEVEEVQDRWGRDFSPWDLTVVGGLVLYAEDEDMRDGFLDEDEAETVAERHPEQIQVLRGHRVKCGGTGRLGQVMENEESTWVSIEYRLIIAAPGVTKEQVKGWAAEAEDEDEDETGDEP